MSPSFMLDRQRDLDRHLDESEFESTSAWYPACKGVADRLVATLLLLLLAPVIVFLMALVKATSRGPAIYKQLRLGRDAKPYYIFKLRSMQYECERLTGPRWATKGGDPRATRIGRFLRLSHLDELPQLWNVLSGDMSLVGPRPERPEFIAELERVIPHYRERMKVPPGITGLAQVQLHADEDINDVRRKLRCDLFYLRHLSPSLDLKIMVGTITKVAGVPLPMAVRILHLPGLTGPDTLGEIHSTDAPAIGSYEVSMDSTLLPR